MILLLPYRNKCEKLLCNEFSTLDLYRSYVVLMYRNSDHLIAYGAVLNFAVL